MNKKALLIIIFILAALIFIIYKFLLGKNSDISGLRIISTPQSNIFLNDKLIGKTPLEEKLPPNEYVLKLIPENTTIQVSFWQGKIKLNPSVMTYVNRDLGSSELTSSGEILTLERISRNEAQMSVSTQPDAASVIFDGQERGIAPLFLTDLSPGEHDVAVSTPGFTTRTVRIQLTSGYKLNVNFQMALLKEKETSSSVSITPIPQEESKTQTKGKPYVVIKDTETGFLRVRTGPSKGATESAQVKPGDKYPLLDEKEDWYKISFDDGKEGWISSRYADKKE